MKITSKKRKPEFEPIELTITIESQLEADLMKRFYILDESIPCIIADPGTPLYVCALRFCHLIEKALVK